MDPVKQSRATMLMLIVITAAVVVIAAALVGPLLGGSESADQKAARDAARHNAQVSCNLDPAVGAPYSESWTECVKQQMHKWEQAHSGD